MLARLGLLFLTILGPVITAPVEPPQPILLEPGCTNPQMEEGFVTADCLDAKTGRPFLCLDSPGRFKAAYEESYAEYVRLSNGLGDDFGSSDLGVQLADSIYRWWAH